MSKRQMLTLASFMCVKVLHGIAGPCVETCGGCGMRDTYRRALAYQRCARLLRVVDARFLARIEGVFRYVTMWPSAIAAAEHWRAAIRKALREAGL